MDKLLLEKFLQGACSAEEAALVQQWMDEHPEEVDAWMQSIWEQDVTEPMPVKMEMELREEFPSVPVRRFHWWAAAAAAIIICIAGWWWMTPRVNTPLNTIVTISSGHYVLPDQSVVWLKDNARLQVDTAAYQKAERLVTLLSGEAFFEVQKDKAHPFIVQHHDVQTRVLGTSFSVRAGDTVQVTVATGKVQVSHHQKVLDVLLPGKQIRVQPATGAFTQQEVPVWMASLFTKNALQLTNAGFDELALAMNTIYGITLQTNNKAVQQKNYNIRLDKAMPVQQVMEVLALLNKNQYKKLTPSTYLLY
jgi:transmembrane sensor